MRRTIRVVGLVFLAATVAAVAACSKTNDDEEAEDVAVPRAESDEPVTVRDGDSHLIFRYYDPEAAKMKTARTIEEIPILARAAVIVHDERKLIDYRAGDPLTVADLRSPGPDGVYPSKLQDPYAFEATLPRPKRPSLAARSAPASAGAPERPAPAVAGVGRNDVILFSAESCPYCRRARAFFQRKGVRFTERDVEKDPRARPLLVELGRAAGVDPALLGSVPIIWLRGKLLIGFDEQQISRLLD